MITLALQFIHPIRIWATTPLIKLTGVSQRHVHLLLGIAMVLGIFYIWEINSLATLGYQIKDLEQQRYQLRQVNQKLSVETVDASSSATILKRLEAIEMVPVGSISYIKQREGVAVNK